MVNTPSFVPMRPDLNLIQSLIPAGSRVMDIGCGDGQLLEQLKIARNLDARGMELSQKNVSACVARGLSVVQGDADTDLAFYPDQSFDYAIMTETLQATRNPRLVVEQLLRIAKHVIVSFPNFGHWSNRLYLLGIGQMPVTKQLSYAWYETPNIHFCTIADFTEMCEAIGCRIERRIALNSSGQPVTLGVHALENLLGTQGLFVLSRKFR